ncbi:carboxylesterase/lipase family protein [Actinomadura atramentaria]|uniref:carboxylesterase/lipase family protein n=1 Tax=Actinomadura atramentaria TaxID=1990 RepID=UPI00037939B5|nr:carboxylesterase family protein [Actinomadura atramentaria]
MTRFSRAAAAVLAAVSLGAFLPASASAAPAHDPVVATRGGVLRGTAGSGADAYLGVPYAAPPTGALRWRPPQAAARWTGVRAADRPGAACLQPGAAGSAEDCLYLNVYTPPGASRGRAKYPVMVYLHGGAFVTGKGSAYDPTELTKNGVIVVTVNYRLGALGFLAHPSLAGRDGSAGNYGLMDQQAALRWVRDDIARFGGKPGDVTVFGESAGGLSVLSQLVSPGSAGLFSAAINQSGAYGLTLPTRAAAERQGASFATAAGCADQSAACLRALPAATVLAHQQGSYLPDVDGRVLPRSLDDALRRGAFHRVPVVNGTTHNESSYFVALMYDLSGGRATPENYLAGIQAMAYVSADQARRVAAQYPLSRYGSPAEALSALGTDADFACPALSVDRWLAGRVPTYAYEFNDPNPPELYLAPVSFPYGAAHATELQYLFTVGNAAFPAELSPDQQRLAATMRRDWASFATAHRVAGWPRFTASGQRMRSYVPPGSKPMTGFADEHRCGFWSTVPRSY